MSSLIPSYRTPNNLNPAGNMQFIKLFAALIMTVTATAHSIVKPSNEQDVLVEPVMLASCSNTEKIKSRKYEKEGYAIPLFGSPATGVLI